MATWGMMWFLDATSPTSEQVIFFHDHVLVFLGLITALVGGQMISLFSLKLSNHYVMAGDTLELIWTLLPSMIVLSLVIPSLRILYMLDYNLQHPHSTIKVIGHQWYWSYEYGTFESLQYDSYMIPTNELKDDEFRLLDVDNRLTLPNYQRIRMLITSSDVLHSWTVPALGVKIDATPGRLNQIMLTIYRSGLYYGQCSEICGANHSFMPIVVQAMPENNWLTWMINQLSK